MKRLAVFSLVFAGLTISTTVCDAQLWIITTFAGNGTGTYGGDGGQAKLAGLVNPSGVAVDRKGNVYIADQNGNRVRKVDTAGVITTIAGTGHYGYTGDGGQGDTATVSASTGVATDKYGNVYIADQFNNAIRKVDTNGIITTVAGSGTLGFGGDSSLATNAMLYHPVDLGLDTVGNMYIIDQDNQRVRKVDTAGIITTIAGNGTSGYSGDGGPATLAQLQFPAGGGQVDKYGNVYIADFYNNRIRKVDTAGMISTVAGNGNPGFSGDNGFADSAEIYNASAVGLDDSGNIYISDYYNNRIRKVSAETGVITTVAGNGTGGYSGDDSAAVNCEIFHPQGVAVGRSGNVFIADFNNHVVREVKRVDTGTISTGISADPQLSFNVFPNPSGGIFEVLASGNAHLSATVCNEVGERVFEMEIDAARAIIDLSKEPEGIYILSLRSEKSTSVQKLEVRR